LGLRPDLAVPRDPQPRAAAGKLTEMEFVNPLSVSDCRCRIGE
jgi:hypothetical protein